VMLRQAMRSAASWTGSIARVTPARLATPPKQRKAANAQA
jgi:hypothetical protein